MDDHHETAQDVMESLTRHSTAEEQREKTAAPNRKNWRKYTGMVRSTNVMGHLQHEVPH